MSVPHNHFARVHALTTVAEVSHPAVVSKTTDGDDAGALATAGPLVDFVVFVQRRAGFTALMESKEKRTKVKIKMRTKNGVHVRSLSNVLD